MLTSLPMTLLLAQGQYEDRRCATRLPSLRTDSPPLPSPDEGSRLPTALIKQASQRPSFPQRTPWGRHAVTQRQLQGSKPKAQAPLLLPPQIQQTQPKGKTKQFTCNSHPPEATSSTVVSFLFSVHLHTTGSIASTIFKYTLKAHFGGCAIVR